MERAIHDLTVVIASPSSTDFTLVHTYPLSLSLLAVVYVWQAPSGPQVVAAKGAPEAMAGLCRLDDGGRRAMEEQARAMAQDGLRVLGVARGSWTGERPTSQQDFGFEFLGLLGLADPVRPGVPGASTGTALSHEGHRTVPWAITCRSTCHGTGAA